ncbi:hypothetical protein LCGC14_1945550, partial [marine sediment metagenome]
PGTGEVVTEEHAKNVNERNEALRNEFKKSYNKSEKKYQEWLDKNPQLQPPKYRAEWNEPAWDAISKNPKLLLEPGYLPYKMASAASFSLGILGVNMYAGGIVATLAALPLVSQDLFEDLVDNGATDEQAANLTKYIAPVIAGVEVISDFPLIEALGGKIFVQALKTNIRQFVAERSVSYLLKKGFTTMTKIQI